MSKSPSPSPSFIPFQVHLVSSSNRSDAHHRDSPTSSILKTPTHTFLTSRGSTHRTKKLTFANGPVDLETLSSQREGSQDSTSTTDSGSSSVHTPARKVNGDVDGDGNLLVAISPVKTMKVSPESWTAFQAFKKFEDYANETEKTDFTYSRLSKYRHKEIVPGFVSPPNLSRCPLSHSPPEQHKHTASTNAKYDFTSMYNNYVNNRVLRDQKRYASLSEDETDVSTSFAAYTAGTPPHRRLWAWLVSVVTTIMTYVTAATSWVWSGVTSTVSRLRYGQERVRYKASSFDWSPIKLSNHHFITESSVVTSWYRRVTSVTSTWYYNVRSKYTNSSRRQRLIWLLLPLLLLLGLWLLRAEQEDGFVTASLQTLTTKEYNLIPSLETIPKSILWTSSFIYNKFTLLTSYVGEVIASCMGDIWAGLCACPAYLSTSFSILFGKLTVLAQATWASITSASDFVVGGAWTSISAGPALVTTAITGFLDNVSIVMQTVWNFLVTGVHLVLGFSREYLFYLGELCSRGVLSAWDGVLFVCECLSAWLFILLNGVRITSGNVFTGLFAKQEEEDGFQTRTINTAYPQELFEQHKAIAKMARELKDLEHINGDLLMLRQKIEELEEKLRVEKDERLSGEEGVAKAVQDNYKTLQQYQVRVNHALRRCCQRSQPVQHLLHAEAEQLKQWIAAHYWSKEDGLMSDQRIATLVAEQVNLWGAELEAFKVEFAAFVKEHREELTSLREGSDGHVGVGVTADYVRRVVTDAIKLYDADKTGKVDYALEMSGGQVQSIRCTETYIASSRSYFLYGWPVYTSFSSPRDAINPGTAPGQCWAFVGSQGYLVLLLSHTVLVTGFTLEHVSRLLVPDGHIQSAPKNFTMWGLQNETDTDPHLFGEYAFLDNDETLQYFPVQHSTTAPFQLVEIKILSNHGNAEYTCLYRIRVHGKVHHGPDVVT